MAKADGFDVLADANELTEPHQRRSRKQPKHCKTLTNS